MFQSTPPRGGRPQVRLPDRGFEGFNPRPRAGGDQLRPPRFVGRPLFQSTPPRGGRRHIRSAGLSKLIVSIHAPARGATVTLTAEPA